MLFFSLNQFGTSSGSSTTNAIQEFSSIEVGPILLIHHFNYYVRTYVVAARPPGNHISSLGDIRSEKEGCDTSLGGFPSAEWGNRPLTSAHTVVPVAT